MAEREADQARVMVLNRSGPPRVVDQGRGLVVPDADLRLQAVDEPVDRPRLRFGQWRWTGIEGSEETSPMPRRVAVQIDAMSVLTSVRGATVRVELIDYPDQHTGRRRRRPQPPGDRLSCRLVAMDTADREKAPSRRRLTHLIAEDRPALNGVTEDHRACRHPGGPYGGWMRGRARLSAATELDHENREDRTTPDPSIHPSPRFVRRMRCTAAVGHKGNLTRPS